MTALAQSRSTGFTLGLNAPSAGPTASRVAQLMVVALEALKARCTAGSAYVFNDLQMLADEYQIDARTTPVLQLAQLFLLALPSHLAAPELNFDSDGEIVFDWAGATGELLTVALRGDGRLSYAARLSAWDKEHGTKRFVDSIPQAVLNLVQRVASR